MPSSRVNCSTAFSTCPSRRRSFAASITAIMVSWSCRPLRRSYRLADRMEYGKAASNCLSAMRRFAKRIRSSGSTAEPSPSSPRPPCASAVSSASRASSSFRTSSSRRFRASRDLACMRIVASPPALLPVLFLSARWSTIRMDMPPEGGFRTPLFTPSPNSCGFRACLSCWPSPCEDDDPLDPSAVLPSPTPSSPPGGLSATSSTFHIP
mmetsp:Transcript_38009/g.69465  ORF Transcript_38009/g.69465 Transcript_38009/m.69465 type:complete len:209 (-) Transcript_38009:45-671(-)